MGYMFFRCEELIKLDLSSFNTKNVETMDSMFYGCIKLASLDLANFKTDKLANVNDMFGGCKTLAQLDDSNFNSNTLEMFKIAQQGIPQLDNQQALLLALLKMVQGFK